MIGASYVSNNFYLNDIINSNLIFSFYNNKNKRIKPLINMFSPIKGKNKICYFYINSFFVSL
jgi:hypothetical protein